MRCDFVMELQERGRVVPGSLRRTSASLTWEAHMAGVLPRVAVEFRDMDASKSSSDGLAGEAGPPGELSGGDQDVGSDAQGQGTGVNMESAEKLQGEVPDEGLHDRGPAFEGSGSVSRGFPVLSTEGAAVCL